MASNGFLIATGGAVIPGGLGLLYFRRPAKPTVAHGATGEPRAHPEQWGVEITAPSGERARPRAQTLLGKRFALADRPPLPLTTCPNPQQCECRYIKLLDQRHEERRSGKERRLMGTRFEKDNPPRRSGKPRRKKDHIDWDGGQVKEMAPENCTGRSGLTLF